MAPPTVEQVTAALPKPVKSVSSASYAFTGIYYFFAHPYLWPLLRGRLFPAFFLSIAVLVVLFTTAYLPQVAFLKLFHGAAQGGAWLNGVFLVLGESAAIIAMLFEAFFVDETQVDIFDAILVDKGYEDLVERSRPVDGASTNTDPVKRLGKPQRSAQYAPFSARQIIELILLLPLNFVPVVGVPCFLILTGYRAGPYQHWRYFALLELTKQERKAYIKRNQWAYTWFGTMYMILELVPPFSIFFLLTLPAGSALWAAELEKQRRLQQGARTEGPEYSDEPV